MVLSFEEKDRSVIESHGMIIIEFKQSLYKLIKNTSNTYEIIKYSIDNVIKALEVFKEKLLEVIDNVKFMVEQTTEAWNYPTSRRYRFVKFLSKCTGIEKRKLWKMTRHTWLARSYC